MDYELVDMLFSCKDAGVPAHLERKAFDFQNQYSDNRFSNSKCEHMGEGWFVIYDFPTAENWARECTWKAKSHRCTSDHFSGKPKANSYTLVYFSDPKGEMEMKLRWC